MHAWTAAAYNCSGNSVSSAPFSVVVQSQDTMHPVVAVTQRVNTGTVARKSRVLITAGSASQRGSGAKCGAASSRRATLDPAQEPEGCCFRFSTSSGTLLVRVSHLKSIRRSLRELGCGRIEDARARNGDPGGMGARFRRLVLAALPDIEALELVERFFALGAEVVGTPHPVGIFLARCVANASRSGRCRPRVGRAVDDP